MDNINSSLESNVQETYKVLPENSCAIICGKIHQGEFRPYEFAVELGIINHYNDNKSGLTPA